VHHPKGQYKICNILGENLHYYFSKYDGEMYGQKASLGKSTFGVDAQDIILSIKEAYELLNLCIYHFKFSLLPHICKGHLHQAE
jgi:hypothetical protein